jgi:hypothetical protein
MTHDLFPDAKSLGSNGYLGACRKKKDIYGRNLWISSEQIRFLDHHNRDIG